MVRIKTTVRSIVRVLLIIAVVQRIRVHGNTALLDFQNDLPRFAGQILEELLDLLRAISVDEVLVNLLKERRRMINVTAKNVRLIDWLIFLG